MLLELLASIPNQTTSVFTDSSSVSWGVLVTFAAGGLGTASFLWKTISSSIEKAAEKTVKAIEKLEVKVDAVERTARSDNERLWAEHLSQRDKVVELTTLHPLVGEVRRDIDKLKVKIAARCPQG